MLADVATGVGFYDQSALNKHFKRCYGITPTQFARAAAASPLYPSGRLCSGHITSLAKQFSPIPSTRAAYQAACTSFVMSIPKP